MLRHAGYPVATVTAPARCGLSRYMQFIHYAVFGLACLRDMNFVTQPSVELYKSITNQLHASAEKLGGIEKTKAWEQMRNSPQQARWRGRVTLFYDGAVVPGSAPAAAPEIYAAILRGVTAARRNRIRGVDIFWRHALFGARPRSADALESRRGNAIPLAPEDAGGCLRRSGDESFLS